VQSRTAWQAITNRPGRFLGSSWPWRAFTYLVSGVLVGIGTLVSSVVLLTVGTVLIVVVVGVATLPALVLFGTFVARVERRRLRLVDRDPVADPHRQPIRPGLWAWALTRLREQATWREFGYAMLSAFALWLIDALVIGVSLALPVAGMLAPVIGNTETAGFWVLAGLGLLVLPASAYPITSWAAARGALARSMVAPRETELGDRLVEVARSRARLVDSFELERRRIERDLHDGAQQRLVALSLKLGLARLGLPPDSEATRQVGEAQNEAKAALAELRELIRGVHPQVLADRGLAAAIREVADRSTVPVDVDVTASRVAEAVEVTAYYAVCEALANVAKHSQASRAHVRARLVGGQLVLEVRDDGVGGADPAGGSGLIGLADRIAVVDGRLFLSSPPGGPTIVQVEIPCNAGSG
jgi:signal transduction histidine kinase